MAKDGEESMLLLELFKDVGDKLTKIVALYDSLETIPARTRLLVIQQEASRLYYRLLDSQNDKT